MKTINLEDPVVDAIQNLFTSPEDSVERFVNAIAWIYAQEGFIKRSEVAGMVIANKIIRKNAAEGMECFDEVTQTFKGIVVTGKLPSEALFIPSEKLHDLLKDNQVILVMKSQRTKGISVQEVDEVYVKLRREEMF